MKRVVCALIMCAGWIHSAHAAEWYLHAGSDILGEQFVLIDEDTLDYSLEYRGMLRTRWNPLGEQWENAGIENTLSIGNLALRESLTGEGTRRFSNLWAFDTRGQMLLRHYWGNDSDNRSDWARAEGRATVKRSFSNDTELGFEQGMCALAYRTGSPVYLDSYRHWHGFTFQQTTGFRYGGARCVLEHEIVPDSTELTSWGMSAGLYGVIPVNTVWELNGDASLRTMWFDDTDVQPNRTTLFASLGLSRRIGLDWSVEYDPDIRILHYAPSDSTFYSTWNMQNTVDAVRWFSWGYLRGGPVVGWQRASSDGYDEYDVIGGHVDINVLSVVPGVIDASIEAGHVGYTAEHESVYTDHYYWDVTLLLSLNTPWDTRFDVSFVLSSRHHDVWEDNSRSFFLTVDLSRLMLGDTQP